MENNPKQIKYLIILLSILLAISVILAGFFAYQTQNLTKEIKKLRNEELITQTLTPSSTVGWKTYISTDNSFTFKFPDDWQVQPANIFGSRTVNEFRYNNNPFFEVSLVGNYSQITGKRFSNLEEYIGKTRSQYSKNIIINNLLAVKITDPGDGGHIIPYEEMIIFSKDNNNIISLYFNYGFYPESEKGKVFDQILSTFKFLDEEIPTITTEELNKGWYWGSIDQKKTNTPSDWIYKEAGRSSCWHKMGVICQ